MKTPAPSPATIRAVWAAVTRQPRATLMQLTAACGKSDTTVWHALRVLRARGYIDYPARTRCARTIIIPFVEVHHE